MDEGAIPAWAGLRNDEPFDVKVFLASRAAPPDNAAPIYMRGLELLSDQVKLGVDSPLEKEVASLVKEIDKLVANPARLAQIHAVLAKAEPGLKLIDEAQAKPKCVFITGLHADSTIPHAMAARTVARFGALQVVKERMAGESVLGESALNRTLRLSRDLQPRGVEVVQLVSIAIDGIALSSIQTVILSDPRLTAEQIDRLLVLLDRHQQQTPMRAPEGVRMGYIFSRNSIEDIRSGRLTLREFTELTIGNQPEQSLSHPPLFNNDAEIAVCNRLYKHLIAAAQKPLYTPNLLTEYQQELDRCKAEYEAFKQLSETTSPAERPKLVDRAPSMLFHVHGAAMETFFEANRRAAAQLAGVQMLLALKRYQLVHGKLPDNLQQAAAECALKTVPVDPYDGQQLRYAVVSGKPTVYSIGSDRKDDGGTTDWNFGKNPGDFLFVLP